MQLSLTGFKSSQNGNKAGPGTSVLGNTVLSHALLSPAKPSQPFALTLHSECVCPYIGNSKPIGIVPFAESLFES